MQTHHLRQGRLGTCSYLSSEHGNALKRSAVLRDRVWLFLGTFINGLLPSLKYTFTLLYSHNKLQGIFSVLFGSKSMVWLKIVTLYLFICLPVSACLHVNSCLCISPSLSHSTYRSSDPHLYSLTHSLSHSLTYALYLYLWASVCTCVCLCVSVLSFR